MTGCVRTCRDRSGRLAHIARALDWQIFRDKAPPVPSPRVAIDTGDTMAGQFVLKRSGNQFMFNLFAGNGEVILTSERYAQKGGAQVGIQSVKANAPHEARYER